MQRAALLPPAQCVCWRVQAPGRAPSRRLYGHRQVEKREEGVSWWGGEKCLLPVMMIQLPEWSLVI